jgi:hypothetical protein
MSQPTTVNGCAEIVGDIVEWIPTVRDDVRYSAFFRCAAECFAPTFTLGSSFLLANYDHPEPPHAPHATTLALAR